MKSETKILLLTFLQEILRLLLFSFFIWAFINEILVKDYNLKPINYLKVYCGVFILEYIVNFITHAVKTIWRKNEK